jgi:hypothetical protein
MSSNAARRREQQRLREGLAPGPPYAAFAHVDLASIDSLLDESAAAAGSAQKRWPATAETYELHTVLEAAIAASTQQPYVIVRSKW